MRVQEGETLATCGYCGNQFAVHMDSPDFTIDRGVLIKYNGGSREVEVPLGVRAIGTLAFYGQHTITKIVLPEGVEELQGVLNCNGLETLILPASLKHIPSAAFSDCVSLTKIVLPSELRNIGNLAFCNCKSLTEIELPATLPSVEKMVFYNCHALTTITLYAETKLIGDFYVGCESLQTLRVLDNWSDNLVAVKTLALGTDGCHYEVTSD